MIQKSSLSKWGTRSAPQRRRPAASMTIILEMMVSLKLGDIAAATSTLKIHLLFCFPFDMSNATQYKLVYFEGSGYAQSIRAAFHIAGIPLEFEGLDDSSFAEAKAAGRFKVGGAMVK